MKSAILPGQLDLFGQLDQPGPRVARPMTANPTLERARGTGCVLRHCRPGATTLGCACVQALPDEIQEGFKDAFRALQRASDAELPEAKDYWFDTILACRQILRELLGPERIRR